MSLNSADRLLIAMKIVVNDMDAIARLQVDAPVFFGMGQALTKMFMVFKKLSPEQVNKINALEMMKAIRDMPLEGVDMETLKDNKKIVRLM